MKIALVFFSLLMIHPFSSIGSRAIHSASNPGYGQAIDYEIISLLEKLSTRRTEDKSGIRIEGPSTEVQEEVPIRLREIANKSPDARARVIYWLIRVLEDPTAREESTFATRWITAVRLLGQLKATEGIDALVANLDQTSQNGEIVSIHFRPVLGAVISIGNPAVPKLVEALLNHKPSIRREAAFALSEIGGNEAMKAIERAAANETDEHVLEAIKAIFRNRSPGPPVEVSREASSAACSNGQIVAAGFYVTGPDSVPVMQHSACTRAPVEITRMSVHADGTYYIYFKNLDAVRKVVGVAYLITTLDLKGEEEGDTDFIAGLLEKPTEPGGEMNVNPERPHGRIKSSGSKICLVRFSSIRFDDGSEWHLNTDCGLSSDLTNIRCKEAKQ